MPNEKALELKKAAVEKIAENLKDSCIGVIVSYKGITVEADTKLRKELRENRVKYSVVKNTLLKRASQIADLNVPDDIFKGSTALAVCKEDYIAPAKILHNFAKDNEFFKVKCGFIDGKLVTPEEIQQLAKLPSKEVLIAKALGGMQSPITGFAGVLNGVLRGLVIALNAVAEKKSA